MKKIATTILLLFSALPLLAENTVKSVNQAVSEIDRNIKAEKYGQYVFSYAKEHEASPPEYKIFYDDDKLVAVFVSVGHESWGYEFRYYYDKKQRIQKYLRITDGRPDVKNKRAGIIYKQSGKVLWQNAGKAHADPKEIKKLFRQFYSLTKQLSGY